MKKASAQICIAALVWALAVKAPAAVDIQFVLGFTSLAPELEVARPRVRRHPYAVHLAAAVRADDPAVLD